MRKQLSVQPDSHWSDHVPAALMMLRFSYSTSLKVPPFTVVTGRTPIPPCYAIQMQPAPDPDAETPDYLAWLHHRITLMIPPPKRGPRGPN